MNMMRTPLMLAVSVFSLFIAPPAVQAQDPGSETHDGFFLRLALGVGAFSAEADQGIEVGGRGMMAGSAIGWAVAENLILHLSSTGVVVYDPEVSVNGNEKDINVLNGTTSTGSSVSFRAIVPGIGVTYYIMPYNIYVSGSIGPGTIEWFNEVSNTTIDETDSGPFVVGQVGKEWWVSDKWGLGAAVVVFGGVGDSSKFPDRSWQLLSGGLVFSSTYN